MILVISAAYLGRGERKTPPRNYLSQMFMCKAWTAQSAPRAVFSCWRETLTQLPWASHKNHSESKNSVSSHDFAGWAGPENELQFFNESWLSKLKKIKKLSGKTSENWVNSVKNHRATFWVVVLLFVCGMKMGFPGEESNICPGNYHHPCTQNGLTGITQKTAALLFPCTWGPILQPQYFPHPLLKYEYIIFSLLECLGRVKYQGLQAAAWELYQLILWLI